MKVFYTHKSKKENKHGKFEYVVNINIEDGLIEHDVYIYGYAQAGFRTKAKAWQKCRVCMEIQDFEKYYEKNEGVKEFRSVV